MTRWLNKLQPTGIFILRVVLGAAMLYHGWPKVIGSGGLRGNHFAALDHFAHYTQTLGMPRWMGYASAFTEFLGGVCLILGLLTRFCAFLMTINMIVAIATVDIYHGYAGSEYALALGAMAFLLLLTGSGNMAVDRRLGLS
jgi:putative oxidoreductase